MAAIVARAPALGWLGGASTLAVLAGMFVASPRTAAAGVAGLAGVWAVATVAHPSAWAVAAGAGVYLVSELAFGAADLSPTGRTDERAEAPRWIHMTLVAALAAAISGLAVGAARHVAVGGLAIEATGLAATVAVIGVVLALVRRASRPEPPGDLSGTRRGSRP